MRLATAVIAAALLFGASAAQACGHMGMTVQKPADTTTAETAPIVLPGQVGS
jgi:methionine-rich copper-binding protein CopC